MSKQFVRSAKNVMKGYSSTQVLVRDATSNDNRVTNIDTLDDIASRSYDSVDFFEIMDMLDKRLNDKGKYWKHIVKSLTVLDYLVRFGSENCVLWCKENLYVIKTLREFRYEDDTGIDQGQIIRVKAKELTSLLQDEERLREERRFNNRRNRRNNRSANRSRATSRSQSNIGPDDDDLQRVIEESKKTAEEDERRRKELARYDEEDPEFQAALQLSKEEEELKNLQDLQRQQQQLQMLQQQQTSANVYYDVFGNPISYDEYMEYQQQKQLWEQQQEQQRIAQEQYLAQQQQQAWEEQQQALAQQQLWDQQQQQLQQQQQQQLWQQEQVPMVTGSNNPFSMDNLGKVNNAPPPQPVPQPQLAVQSPPQQIPQVAMPPLPQQQEQQPLKQNRTGNEEITEKYSELNNLLAQGTGVDTFGNTGQERIPAQHTKTGTFINSQGTGYKQVTNERSKNNPFLNTQYTGLPSSNIVPSSTGYGFGNQPQDSAQNQYSQQQQQYSQPQYNQAYPQQQQQQQQPNQQYQQMAYQQQYNLQQPQQQSNSAAPDQSISLIDL
ncbi:hypothetical protein KAFR_0L01460 [Kazachstania africana CBS 2517]|uniref:ENTH domain-containing protein n=1 Tax=Kazachstania africana (strain ATCC 22294 / BCRC 22015 / CBS 2517 / CECT 1963 / NBRC 1671 / NRRL Y-8276) TaxID=1071382 RepID=H2B2A5_KAZAF|nr:hypothetical protein KAFR_0L01460 [Kazachstania africana CBS 2517]CCF60755.1 hypothetical protein KAFR_0L01460 [Kazachstania africana CBS 2517]